MAVIDLSVETQEQRIADAVVRCVARWGVTKTTLDDVAREAGCSRATVYRVFPGGKDALLLAAVRRETTRFFAGLEAELAGAGDDLEDVLVRAMTHAGRFLSGHEALRFLLVHEPEVILPRISFDHMREVLRQVSDFTAPHLEPHVGPEEAPRAAEWVARLVCSYVMSPGELVDVRDEESVRSLVRSFVLPGLTTRTARAS